MDFSVLIVIGIFVVCGLALSAVRRMPNEVPSVTERVEVTIEQNLTLCPEKRTYEMIYPLMSTPPFCLPDIPHREYEPSVRNVLLSHEYPMLPIIFTDHWVAPGSRCAIVIHRDKDGEVIKVEKA